MRAAALRAAKRTAAFAAVGALAIAGAALFRPVRFPVPGGPHRVGTALRHWRDPERAELLAPGEGRIRELPAQIWYPTATTSGERARYLRAARMRPAPARRRRRPLGWRA